MSRSQYKPSIPIDLSMVNLDEKEQAFFRVADKPGRRIFRLITKSGSSILMKNHIKFRILIHNGRRYRSLIVSKKMLGFRLGEFRRTKRTIRIHVNNKTARKRQKKIARLKMDAKRRKNKKRRVHHGHKHKRSKKRK